MVYFIDTNIFLRVLYKEYPLIHQDCRIFLQAVKENKINACTATVVLAEVAYTLKSYYKFDKEKILEGLKGIVNLANLDIIDTYNHLLALQLFEKYSVKYIDALIASMDAIQNKQMTIISYDLDFDKLPVLRKEPNQIVRQLKIRLN